MDNIRIRNSTVSLIKGDITTENVEAIVNAANSGLRGGGGVDGAIHRAGGRIIFMECQEIITRIGSLEAGKCVITCGGSLAADYVIHTVGPVWKGGKMGESAILASCYTESLRLADSRKIKTIAFPAISTGVYGYPLADASEIAVKSVKDYINGNETGLQEIRFVLYDENAYRMYQKILIP